MMKKRVMLLIVVLGVAAFPGIPAAAKSYFDIVTVVGPDWYGEIELTGSQIPDSLIHGGFFNPQQPISAPSDLGRGYLITRGYDNDGDRQMFDRFMYFPGSPGYVYYLEIINGSGPYDGHWFSVPASEGEELLSTLEAKGVGLAANLVQTSLAAPEPATEPLNFMPVLGLGIAVLVGGTAGWMLRAARDRARLANIA